MAMVANEISCRARGVGGVGFLLHAVNELLHADAEPDIELAGFLQNGLGVIVRIQFLLADLEDAGLAFAQRRSSRVAF